MISVLVFKFREDELEWPLYASSQSREAHLRWRASFQREIERRERNGLPVVGTRAVVQREPEHPDVEGGDDGNEHNRKDGEAA